MSKKIKVETAEGFLWHWDKRKKYTVAIGKACYSVTEAVDGQLHWFEFQGRVRVSLNQIKSEIDPNELKAETLFYQAEAKVRAMSKVYEELLSECEQTRKAASRRMNDDLQKARAKVNNKRKEFEEVVRVVESKAMEKKHELWGLERTSESFRRAIDTLIRIRQAVDVTNGVFPPASIPQQSFRPLPSDGFPCVYFLMRGLECVYVGKTSVGFSRIGSHSKDKTFGSVFVVPVHTDSIGEFEADWILRLKPLYNIAGLANEL